MRMSTVAAAAIGCSAIVAGSAQGAMRITEWMYNGVEYVEFTNVGATPIDMTGWSYDDSARIAGTFSLSDYGVVQGGESVILTEESVEYFRELWNLDESIKVIGNLGLDDVGNNLGRNDEINLFDANGDLVDRLTYGDGDFPGSIRTQGPASGITVPEFYGTNDVTHWFFSEEGDAYGSFQSVDGSYIGSPGYADVPEPAALSLLGVGSLLTLRRRRDA